MHGSAAAAFPSDLNRRLGLCFQSHFERAGTGRRSGMCTVVCLRNGADRPILAQFTLVPAQNWAKFQGFDFGSESSVSFSSQEGPVKKLTSLESLIK